ncbi:hypothetical protein AADZ84_09035 [Colwelliaceae bacterium MEBiC 14330]
MNIIQINLKSLILTFWGFFLLGSSSKSVAFDLKESAEEAANISKSQLKENKPELSFALTRGEQYELCHDLLSYLNKSYNERNELEKTHFTAQSSLFFTPIYNPIKPDKGLKIDMQNAAYANKGMYGFSGWLKSIQRYEKRFNATKYYETQVDLNNDGQQDRVQTHTFFHQKYKFTTYSNFPLNNFGNLAVDWFNKQRGSSIGGELFLYRGRTFLLHRYSDEILINEPRLAKRPNAAGISITPNVCKITLQ